MDITELQQVQLHTLLRFAKARKRLRIGLKLIVASALDSMLFSPKVMVTILLLKFKVAIFQIASILVLIYIVNVGLARLVLGWVTVHWFESCLYNLGI